MKISNFMLMPMVVYRGRPCYRPPYKARVIVTTGYWFWKKTEVVMITRAYDAWYWNSGGKIKNNHQLKMLEKAFLKENNALTIKQYIERRKP